MSLYPNSNQPKSTEVVSHFALAVEYDGSTYNGWQAQKSPLIVTVQEELEQALSRVANHPIKLTCAGRTDTGVHASAQIVHFSSTSTRDTKAWVRGGNSFLKHNVSILWACSVNDQFHARFSAQSRRYRYVIYNNQVRPALMKGLVTPVFARLDEQLMHSGGQFLLGENDFTSYRGVACQSKTAMRNIHQLSVKRYGDYVIIDIEANAFLLHMVRNIVGVLLEIGQQRQPPEWVRQVLLAKDRRRGATTAKPDGLYLVAVRYPEKYDLPHINIGPSFLRPFCD